MAVKTKDVVVDYNQLGNPGLTVDANGKNSIRIDNLPNNYYLPNGKLKENGTLVFEYIINSKTLIIENPETIRYIKTHYQKVGKKETYQLVDIYENDFVLNEKTITEYDAKKLIASGTNFKDNMDFSSYAPSESTTKGLTINGGNGSDTIKATDYNDVIKGGTGNDQIEGLQGDDTIYGDAGDDFIRGGDGNDVIYGGSGEDDITGGKGNDTITGGAGLTRIRYLEGDGDDTVYLTKGEKLIIDFPTEGIALSKSEVSYKYFDNKKDLIIYLDETDENQGSITLKNFATKDVLNNATKKTADTSYIKVSYSEGMVDLKNATFEDMSVKTDDIKSNFTGTWLNDDIDASATFLTKKVGKTTVEKDTKDKGLTLDGGNGNDKITGTKYSDTLKGGNGNDSIEGGSGNDIIYGANGEDTIKGGVGNDKIYGGNDKDSIEGGDGNDTIYGDNGNDIIDGQSGDDVIYGGNGDDTITGGAGNDTIIGGAGRNTLNYTVGDGNDVIYLTKGENFNLKISGTTFDNLSFERSSNGKDLLIYTDNTKNEYITIKNFIAKNITKSAKMIIGDDEYDLNEVSVLSVVDKNFAGTRFNDNIDASGTVLFKKFDKTSYVEKDLGDFGLTLSGGVGDDTIKGTNYSDVIKGGVGDDEIHGGSGFDTLYGDNGNDNIFGEDEDDIIYGGNGNDIIDGGEGDDEIYGGNGDDIITGGTGNDTIIGGAGRNTLNYTVGDGNDVIYLTKGENFKLVISGSGITNIEDLSFMRDDNDLLIYTNNINSDEYITIKDFAKKDVTNNATKKTADTSSVILEINGTEYDLRTDKHLACTTLPNGNYTGTYLTEEIDASGLTLFKKVGNSIVEKEAKDRGITLKGVAGDDTIKGTNYSDVIIGGNGDDEITGGTGNDTITGGKGTNKIIYRHGDGNDVVNITKGEDLIIALPNVNNFNDIIFEIAPNGKDLIIRANNNNREEFMTIKDYVTKDILNSGKFLLGDREREEYFSQIKINVDTNKNYTGTRLNEKINASGATKGLTINTGAGNDTVYGSDYNDIIKGTSGSKNFFGEAGNDTIYGTNDINNTLDGGEGDDKIYAGSNCDTIIGGAGNDFIKGGDGDDSIWGDTLSAQESDGNDTIYGEGGNDKIFGNGGDDYIDGGLGDDEIKGGTGNDTIYGGLGNDKITGGEGANYIVYNKGDGDDFITLTKGEQFKLKLKGVRSVDDVEFAVAENGNDYIIYVDKNNHSAGSITLKDFAITDVTNNATETTEDTSYVKLVINGTEYDLRNYPSLDRSVTEDYTGIWRAENIDASSATKGLNINAMGGNDTIKGSNYNDTIHGGAGDDSIRGTAGNNSLYGDDGDDTIYGGLGNDYIEGGLGDDSINAFGGSNVIYGNDGNDTILGGTGNDTIYGNAGDDSIQGNQGNDEIHGGAGNDYISGQQGDDTLYGGAGDDTLDGGYNSNTLYGGEGNDTYIVYFTDETINSVIEDESGTNDVLTFKEWPTGPDTCTKDQLHVVFNVSSDFNILTDTISWVNILDDTNLLSWQKNPTGNFEGVKIKDNAIENIYSSDNYNLTSADISALAQDVAGWLSTKGFADVNDVLTNGNNDDIDGLMAMFNNRSWNVPS